VEANPTDVAAAQLRFASWVETKQLGIENQFITRDNVDRLLAASGPGSTPDLLSIDVDGNDYWIWEAIRSVDPRVVVIEYNATWFPPLAFTIRYQENFRWDGTNYFGASLKALELLGRRKGYCLVGCNFSGVNAFFVRDDLCKRRFREPFTAENHFEPPRYGVSGTAGHPPGVGPVETIS
jgi:hypothetical protein